MSITRYPKLRSDKARVERLKAELTRWESNLLSHPIRSEAQRWKLEAQLDLIESVRDVIN